jgi:hypothetical protein
MKRTTVVLLTSICILMGLGCSRNAAPLTPGAPVGPPVGMVRESLNFGVATTDPESDSIRYRVDWGDGLGDWTGLLASGESCVVGHTWYVRDTYAVRVQAEDEHSNASEWSPAFVVSIESLCRR